MPFSDNYANSILNYLFAKTEKLTAPTYIYMGLSSNDPDADGGAFTELSGGGYHRVLICNRDETYPNLMGSASARSISNTAQINWTKATADWTTVKGFGLFTTSEAGSGTPIYYGALTVEMSEPAVPTGAVALFEAGALRITISSTDESTATTE